MRKIKTIIGITFGLGVAATLNCYSPKIAYAEETISLSQEDVLTSESIILSSDYHQEETSEENKENIVSKINEFKDTYLVPLVSGVSLASIVSAFLSIIIAYFNRKTNLKNKTCVDNLNLSVEDIINNTSSLLNELSKQNIISSEIRKSFDNSTSVLLERLSELDKKAEELDKYKNILISLSTIITKFVSSNSECVKTGLAKEINQISEQIDKLK